MAGRPEGGAKERKLDSKMLETAGYCAALISLTILE